MDERVKTLKNQIERCLYTKLSTVKENVRINSTY